MKAIWLFRPSKTRKIFKNTKLNHINNFSLLFSRITWQKKKSEQRSERWELFEYFPFDCKKIQGHEILKREDWKTDNLIPSASFFNNVVIASPSGLSVFSFHFPAFYIYFLLFAFTFFSHLFSYSYFVYFFLLVLSHLFLLFFPTNFTFFSSSLSSAFHKCYSSFASLIFILIFCFIFFSFLIVFHLFFFPLF